MSAQAKSKSKPKTEKKAEPKTEKKAEPAKEAPATTALAKADEKKLVKEFEVRWTQVTNDLRNRRRQAAADILQYRYDVGVFANDVVEDRTRELGKKNYGDKTVANICESLSESPSTVHTCMKFARKVDKKELEYFKSQEWPWRAVSSLVTVEDPAAYKKLKEDFEKDRFKNTDELKDAAKAANERSKKSGIKTDRRGGSPTALSMVKSFEVSCNQISTKIMPNFMSSVKDFAKSAPKMESDVADKMAAAIKEAKKALESLKKMIERVDEVVKSAGV